MSLKAELEIWAAALRAYDEEDYDRSLELFSSIADSSKILTNIGLIYATLGEHEAAIENFNAATSLDQYLAVAYFQCGVSNFLLQRYDLALKDFEEALLNLRGNQAINYEQLGLKFKLYSAETLFNKGLSKVYMGRIEEGMKDMREASQVKCTSEHNVIDEAIREQAEGYTVFSIPVGVVYRPSETKLKNTASKDYLGKAKLIAAETEREAYTSFTGATRLKQGLSPTGTRLDDVPAKISDFDAAVNLKRAATISSFSNEPNPPTLTRSSTTINVISREERGARAAELSKTSLRPSAAGSNTLPNTPEAAAGLQRSITTSPNNYNNKPTRLTDIYDQYLEDDHDVPSLPDGRQRVAAWARTNANAAPLKRGLTSPTNYAPSGLGLSLRRKTTAKRAHTVNRSIFEEEEEDGFAIRDYEEPVKIRIKIHYDGDVRGMAITSDIPFEEFVDRITQKFDKSFDGLGMKFKDEDGTLITLKDESDYDLALETARDGSKGKSERKLEVWCRDQ